MNYKHGERLKASFFQSEDVLQLSKSLLGKVLVTQFGSEISAGIIVETEAYRAPDDKACHAYNNRRTKRTETMFKNGGHVYVYLCYGIHHLFNIVTGPENTAHAVLVRGIEPLFNVQLMLQRRNFKKLITQLSAGPGVLTKALGISTSQDGINLCNTESPIWLEDIGQNIPQNQIICSPRVGVGYAEECAEWPWRFRIKNNKWCSKAK